MDKSNKKYKQNYICGKCGKIFQSPIQLKLHINSKDEERLFKRGRPKKYPHCFSSEKEIKFIQFF
jgi:DNA-directed RNA polymerase subunit RPC12/RpoP